MKRHQLEHILRAAAGITGASHFVVIGSQAILARDADPPPTLADSLEADLFTLRAGEDSNLIDGSIGEGSPFHQTFGYYAHGVGEDTAVLPQGWKDRLLPLCNENTGGATGLCLEVHDLAVSKLVAGREKDLTFVSGLFLHGITSAETLRQRLAITPLDDVRRQLCLGRIERLAR